MLLETSVTLTVGLLNVQKKVHLRSKNTFRIISTRLLSLSIISLCFLLSYCLHLRSVSEENIPL